MNFCADKTKTKFINFLHSDFYVSKNWDLKLLETHKKYKNKVIELNRLCVNEGLPKNCLSYFVSNALKLINNFDKESNLIYLMNNQEQEL